MYLSGGLGVLFSRLTGIIAGIASLWLLNRILTTEAFAGYMLTFSLVVVLGGVSGFGLERVLVLKIGKLPPEKGILRGGRLLKQVACWVLPLSIVAVLTAILVLHKVPELSQNNEILPWLIRLSPIVPTLVFATLLISWLQSNHSVGEPQSLYGQIDALRCLGIFCVYLLGAQLEGVALAAVAAAIVPTLILAARAARRSIPEPGGLVLSDAKDGLRFFAIRMTTIGFMNADILILGLFASAEIVAPYVIASRFALG